MRQLPAAAVVENGNQWCHRVLFHPWCMCYVCASTAACSVCVTNLCVTTPRVNPTWTLRTCMCTRNTGPIGDAVVYLEEKLVRCPHLHNRRATASSTAPTPRPWSAICHHSDMHGRGTGPGCSQHGGTIPAQPDARARREGGRKRARAC